MAPSHWNAYHQEAHRARCLCIYLHGGFIASVRCCRKEVHVNIYIGFRKQLLRERSLLLFTQIQNKETLQRLPGIDMWACFFSKAPTGRSECLRFIFDRT